MNNSPFPLNDLRVAVVGAGRMGADHVDRLAHNTQRATVSAVVDVDLERARHAASSVPGAACFSELSELLTADAADAVLLATPGFLHEQALLDLVDADIPVLCEKPLTPDPSSALRVINAEVEKGRKLIQVGFMRRFDSGYRHLKKLVDSGELGRMLMLHHQHRNPGTPPGFTNEMVINDSLVHEFDAVRFFTDEEIRTVHVRVGRQTSLGMSGVQDPHHVVLETSSGLLADVEMFCAAQFGYQVATQATFERGVVGIGDTAELQVTKDGSTGSAVEPGFVTRFKTAYDVEIQDWVDAARCGDIAGPSAWDGYAAAACCEAGLASQRSGMSVDVTLTDRPDLYA